MNSFFKAFARKFSRGINGYLLTELNLRRMRGSRLYRELVQREDNQIAKLRAEYAALIRDRNKRTDLQSHEMKIFCQGGEDGLLLHFFSIIGASRKTFIEFGIEDGTECNAANLAIHFGWHGLFIEGSPSLADKARHFYHVRHKLDPQAVRVECAFVDRDNIDALFRQHAHAGDPDLLSIDIDGNDYWVWEALQSVRPRLVVIEYNASFGSEDAVTVPYEPDFDRYKKHPSGWYHGASLMALTKLARTKGYVLAGCDSFGSNAFFIRSDLAEGRNCELHPAEAFYPSLPRLRELDIPAQVAFMRQFPLAKV